MSWCGRRRMGRGCSSGRTHRDPVAAGPELVAGMDSAPLRAKDPTIGEVKHATRHRRATFPLTPEVIDTIPPPAASAAGSPFAPPTGGAHPWRCTMLRPVIILLLVLAGLAVAQDVPPDLADVSFDPRIWFGSAAGLAALVFAGVGFAKEHIMRTLHGWQTIALSFALGIGVAVGGSLTPYFEATLGEAALFGASAALIASGGWDGLKGALRKGMTEAPAATAADIPPSRRG